MQALIEFLPLLIFFIFYKTHDIFWATGALMIAFALQLIVTYAIKKQITKQQWIMFAIVVVFGSFTLLLRDETFIMWKPTIVYLIFAAVLLGSQILKKPALKQMMESAISVPDKIWNRINLAWGLFFIAAAAVNLLVAYQYTQEQWVNFKVFWMTGASLVFTVLTVLYLVRYLPGESEQQDEQ
ncbi:septation protein A [Neptunicella marina]|uniref:Inner membrane-spanning protein YciB n=1 Tax=Neptunicella marina TaxID=2125989 RepID=A0A8J6M057_9ALTE|nr:septation protein A [Neptunicella marina]MBC3764677.1 septation protein A [Neptunicella marina]